MSEFSQKYTIIQLFEDVPEGTEFSADSWPLHATIVDTFAVDCDIRTMVTNLEKLLIAQLPVASVAEDDEFFGPKKQTRVTLLQKTENLITLHYDIVRLLEEGGLKLNDPQFAREGFLPHSTVQKQARLSKGDKVIFNALTIIDMFPNKDPYMRKVIKTIKIGE